MTSGVRKSAVLAEIHSLARPLKTDRDLNGLVRRAADCRFVAIGEASHGTHEFYTWRDTLSRRLIDGGRLQLDRGGGGLARLLAHQQLGAGRDGAGPGCPCPARRL